MAKTRKIMEINDGGVHLVCIKHEGETNPYKLYLKWYDRGWHQHQLERYADSASALAHALDIINAKGVI